MFEKELKTLRSLYEKGVFEAPFYKSRIQGTTVFEDYDSFRKIPLMYKDEIRNTDPFERTTTPRNQVYGIFSSSGTSGEKTYYVYSKTDKEVHEEFVNTFYSELEIDSNDLGGVFAPVDTGVMAHTMMWQFTTRGAGYVNCPVPSPDEMIKVVKTLPVTVIATRPSVVTSVGCNSNFIQAARSSSVRKLILGGGFLSEERRKRIEYLWDADCYNMFGMSEVFGPMAGECKKKDAPHYIDKYLMIEVLNPETMEPVEYGKPGIAVYTTLWNKGFPLLRYWTDDFIRVDNYPCECGRNLPKIRFYGRMADCIKIESDYVFPQEMENCIMKHGFFDEYRALKRKDGTVLATIETYDGVTILDSLKNELEKLFKSEVAIKTVPAGELPYDGHSPRFTTE